MKTLFSFLLIALALQACLPVEEKCRYAEFVDEKHLEGSWNVDSFSVYVNDSAGGYYIDTTYLNNGTITFDYQFKNCQGSGVMTFKRTDGIPYVFTFTIQDYSPNSRRFITLTGPSVDGHPDTYYERHEAYYSENELQILSTDLSRTFAFNSGHPGMLRYWNFKLTRK